MLVGRVIEHQLDDHVHSPFVCGVQKTPEVIEGPVARVDVAVVRDVVSIVAEGRWKERKEPEAIDAKSFEIVEFLDEPWEIADAVRVPVAKRLDGQLVDDRALIPQNIALATLVRHLDRYAARCVNLVLIVTRIAVLGARSAPAGPPRFRHWQPAEGSGGISRAEPLAGSHLQRERWECSKILDDYASLAPVRPSNRCRRSAGRVRKTCAPAGGAAAPAMTASTGRHLANRGADGAR